jgi:Lrp/AsnC family leucine-responsive transcriptional regulator
MLAEPPPTNRQPKLDRVDLDLLEILRENGRATHEEIARRVGLSRPSVHERIRRLERDGIIKGYGIKLNWDALDYPLAAFVWLRASGGRCSDLPRTIMALNVDRVVPLECQRITGDYSMYVKVRARTMQDLERFIDQVKELPTVFSTMTALALSGIES